MTLDPVLLSRLQWAWVIAWHILLPAFTVGLASYIAVLEGLYFLTGRESWFRISGFWTRIFAVSFGMGVVSGIIMPFQFGTNWSRFTDAAADVISPLLSYEGLMAFFLEAWFLGVFLFGRRLVPTWAHFFAAVMVAFGTLLSSFWILATNMDADAAGLQNSRWSLRAGGLDGDHLQSVISLSALHNVIAFYITTAFVVMGVGAWLLRRDRATDEARTMMRMALDLLILLVPLQIFLGDSTASIRLNISRPNSRRSRAATRPHEPRATDLVRHPGRRGGDHARTPSRYPARQSRSHPCLGWRDQGAQGMAGGSAAARRAAVLRVPHHGRHRLHHAA